MAESVVQENRNGTPRLSKWEERHAGALAMSEVGRCLHCAGARLLEAPKTKPFTENQLRRMKIGTHFQGLEFARLREGGADFYPGRLIVLGGLALPVRGVPDFIVRENGGFRIIEVKYRTSRPPEVPREWGYQAGAYSLRYESCPVTFAVYDLEDREEMGMAQPPADLPVILQQWTEALAGLLDGQYQLNDLPHEPYWCRRSEWACEDCIGLRVADTELSVIEQKRFSEWVALRARFDALKQAEKELDAAQEAAKEMLAAHGGTIIWQGMEYRLSESRSVRLDTKAIPPEVRETLPTQEVVSRRIYVKEVGE